MRHVLAIEPLTAAAFAPFGDVIEATDGAPHRQINAGFAERYDDLARIDTARSGGRCVVSIFRTLPRTLPLRLAAVERHTLGSQAFVPLGNTRLLVVVAAAGPVPSARQLRCFAPGPGQGFNLAPGTWHHALLALGAGGDVLVIDRGDALGHGTAAPDCDEHPLDADDVWIEAATTA